MFRSSTVAESFNKIKCRLRIAQIISSLQDIKDYIREKSSNTSPLSATNIEAIIVDSPIKVNAEKENSKSINDEHVNTTDTTSTSDAENKKSQEIQPPSSPIPSIVIADEERVREIIQKYREHWCFLTVHDTQKIVFATLQAYLDADDIGGSAFYKALCVPELLNLLFRLFFDPTMISYSFSLLIKMMQVDFSLLPLGIIFFLTFFHLSQVSELLRFYRFYSNALSFY